MACGRQAAHASQFAKALYLTGSSSSPSCFTRTANGRTAQLSRLRPTCLRMSSSIRRRQGQTRERLRKAHHIAPTADLTASMLNSLDDSYRSGTRLAHLVAHGDCGLREISILVPSTVRFHVLVAFHLASSRQSLPMQKAAPKVLHQSARNPPNGSRQRDGPDRCVQRILRVATRPLSGIGSLFTARPISELMTDQRTGGRLARAAGTQKKSDPSESSIL
ncbi:hypothetical protein QFZ91_005563 [Paraburkholderia sp. JPY419]